MRELNRLGVTGAIDAGGGFQNYPEDYEVIRKLSEAGHLTVRLAYNLFTQKPKAEKEDFLNWTKTSKYKQGDDYFRHNGAGEMLVFSAADFEDFRQPRPDMPPEMEGELEEVVRVLAENRWPWRLHELFNIQSRPNPEQQGSIACLQRLGASDQPAVVALSVTDPIIILIALASAQTV